eukprot:TRINITY_DN32632_c0_g1_i1.p1 TRINITY_DN32632_c0_g1~~TRINITY_DN32632_c0_g1_i1.p1  ORF type:complete len:435 (+),score=75.56 TRINITY_DN32632_c0_g1_i1:67-1371(+)
MRRRWLRPARERGPCAACAAGRRAGRPRRAYRSQRAVDLHPAEYSLPWLLMPSITFVTAFDGPATAVESLRRRVAEVVAANPCLAGRLRREGSAVQVAIPERPCAAQCFAETETRGATPLLHLHYEDIAAAVKPFRVAPGLRCVGWDETLFKVTLFHDGPARFALAVSLSHVLGDGYTFYRVHGMLSPAAPLESLEWRRQLQWRAAVPEGALQEADQRYQNLLLQLGGVANALRGRPRVAYRRLSRQWLQEQREEHSALHRGSPVPLVSASDVAFSWFLRRGAYDYGMTVIGARGWVPGLGGAHAGNYTVRVGLSPEDYATPGALRCLLPPRPRGSPASRRPPPGPAAAIRGNLGHVTSMAGLYRPVEVPGCTARLHFPIVGGFETRLMPFRGRLLLFRSGPDGLGAVLSERGTAARCTLDDPALGPALLGDDG